MTKRSEARMVRVSGDTSWRTWPSRGNIEHPSLVTAKFTYDGADTYRLPVADVALSVYRGKLRLRITLKGENGKRLTLWNGPAFPTDEAVMESWTKIVTERLK